MVGKFGEVKQEWKFFLPLSRNESPNELEADDEATPEFNSPIVVPWWWASGESLMFFVRSSSYFCYENQ